MQLGRCACSLPSRSHTNTPNPDGDVTVRAIWKISPLQKCNLIEAFPLCWPPVDPEGGSADRPQRYGLSGTLHKTSTVLSIDGQVRVLSEKAVGSVDEAEEVAHALAMSNHFPWVDVELLYR